MSRLIRWFSPFACLIALVVFAAHAAKADDAATSQPSAATGSIVVTVLDSDSNPIVKARVQLYPQQKKSDSDDAAPAKPKAIAKAYTGDDGKFTFENLAAGDYKVNASFKKTRSKGSAKVSVTTDTLNPEITITFAAAAPAPTTDSSGGATTAPSTPPSP